MIFLKYWWANWSFYLATEFLNCICLWQCSQSQWIWNFEALWIYISIRHILKFYFYRMTKMKFFCTRFLALVSIDIRFMIFKTNISELWWTITVSIRIRLSTILSGDIESFLEAQWVPLMSILSGIAIWLLFIHFFSCCPSKSHIITLYFMWYLILYLGCSFC